MRLIDADELIKCIPSEEYNSRFVVMNAPTINPQKWIPVSEKLPEVGQNVLLSIGKGMFTAEGCLREDGDWCQFRWSTIWADYYVDAWMPLPEPWKGKEE